MTQNMVEYVPEITINGTTYTTSDPSPEHTALADLQIRWGNSERPAQPDSAILTAAIWNRDPRKLWSLNLIGSHVVVRAAPAAADTTPFTIFTGVVTDQSLSRRSERRGDDDTFGGFICELTAADVRTQLANTICTVATMPRETHAQRVTRILAEFPDPYGQITGHDMPTWGSSWGDVEATESAGRSLADLLDEVYLAYASTWVHNPVSGDIFRLPIQVMPAPDRFQLDIARGELFATVVNTYADGTFTQPATPGRYCTIDGPLDRSASNEVAQVELAYKHPTGSGTSTPVQDRTLTRKTTQPTAPFSASVARFDTQALGTTLPIALADRIMNLYDQLRASWLYPEITYRSDLAGGFVNRAQASFVLGSRQTNDRMYITGSWFSKYNPAPVCFVFLGGTTRWTGDHWEATLLPSPMVEPMGYQTPVTWAGLAPSGLTQMHWNTPGRRLHDSVTWEDLRFISRRNT